ncbi:MAG: DNA polymerase III subunit gamma/tau [Pedobacter sp.]|nr:MAG: DNA polymerase III subunit gamma/tau [Pedobacter sp.]
MENFVVSARKYRPATFETVVGQSHITSTLKNAIKNNQLAQAFLFCGPRGVGKTTCARILAKTINCTSLSPSQEACGTCESCQSFSAGHSFNFHELDAASNNSVEDIRSLIDQVRIPPQAGKFKIYIIDEVHMLSQSAFNAFLKTLEEPPSYAIFILATTEKHKILPTILSRCQIFDFNRISVDHIASHLNTIAEREGITTENDALHIIAQKADGGLRDALSMFDQIVSFTNKQVSYKSVIANLNILDYDFYFKLVDHLQSSAGSDALLLFNEVLNQGFDGNHFINGLAEHLRNLLVSKEPRTVSLLEVSENIKQKYLSQSQLCETGFLLTALNLANTCDLNYKNSKNQRLQVELALLKMAHINAAIQLAQVPLANPTDSSDLNKKKTPITKKEVEVKPTAKVTPIEPIASSTSSIIQEAPRPSPIAIPKPLGKSIQINPAHAATGSLLIPSLNDITAIATGVESNEPQLIKGDAQEKIKPEEFYAAWEEYKEKAKAADKINLYTVLNNEPKIEAELITVFVENTALESTLQAEKIELLNFLRTKLRNFNLNLEIKKAVLNHKRRIYTNKDKYAYLLDKNPILATFKDKFGLDLLP